MPFFDALAGGLLSGLAVAGGIGWFGKQVFSGMMTATADRFRSHLKIDEIIRQAGIQATSDFMSRQLSEFYWPVYIRLQRDNAIWDRILDAASKDQMRSAVGRYIETNDVLPNHDEIVTILQSKIHLAQPDDDLQLAMMRYVRHVAVYRAIRKSGDSTTFPLALNEPWPDNFFPLIRDRTKQLQARYDSFIKDSGLVPS